MRCVTCEEVIQQTWQTTLCGRWSIRGFFRLMSIVFPINATSLTLAWHLTGMLSLFPHVHLYWVQRNCSKTNSRSHLFLLEKRRQKKLHSPLRVFSPSGLISLHANCLLTTFRQTMLNLHGALGKRYEPFVFVLRWFLKHFGKEGSFRNGLMCHFWRVRRGLQNKTVSQLVGLLISARNQSAAHPEVSARVAIFWRCTKCGSFYINLRCRRASQSVMQAHSKSAIHDLLSETIATQPPMAIIQNAFRLRKGRSCEMIPHLKFFASLLRYKGVCLKAKVHEFMFPSSNWTFV